MSEELIKVPCQFGETGNFLLERALGAGGMGGVYMGRDKMLDRPVAVKVMLKEFGSDAEFVEKFKREAQAAAKLLHPNIAQIYSYGISDGMPYIAMELATGGSLDSIMEHSGAGKTEVPRVMKICQQVAQALACAADHGLVHGDVKPENILLDSNGNAKLVDFGLAAMQKDTSEIWGTPYYISPEKVKKEVVDYRADMYSLGGTLYHALTGVPPFEGDDTTAVVKARFVAPPKKPSELRPGLSPQIDALVMQMLAFDKADRFPSFEALLEEFKKVMTTGLSTSQKVVDPTTTTTSTKTPTTKGGKKIVMKPKKGGLKITPKTTEAAEKPEGDEGVQDGEAKPENEEEEEKDNLGLKVIGVIGGVIALIVVVAGGLVWYKVSAANAEKEAHHQQIVSGISQARAAIVDTADKAQKFAQEFETFAQKAVDEVEKPTNELKSLVPEFAAMINPAPGTAPFEGEIPGEINEINELWTRANECIACSKKIAADIAEIIAICESAKDISGESEEAMNKLGDISRQAVEKLDAAKNSKEVETVKKGITFIKSKGSNTVKRAADRLRREALEKGRKEKAEAEAKAEADKKAAADAARKAKVEEETASIQDKFKQIADDGRVFKQLDWKSAIRQLETIKSEFTTPEGEQAANLEISKVEAMKSVQDIFIANMKGYTFGKKVKGLKGHTVAAINDKDITLSKPDGGTMKLTWQKFYQNYHGALNDVIINFIEKGRINCKPKLNLKSWSEGMMGAALTMRLICNDDEAAASRGEAIAKEVAKQFPDMIKKLQVFFPDIVFEAAETEE